MRLHFSGCAMVLGMTLVLAAACGKNEQQANTAAASEMTPPPADQAAPNQAPAAGVDPCSLLTADDIKPLVNNPVAAGKVNENDATACDYQVGSAGNVVSVAAKIAAPGETIDNVMAAMKKNGKVGEKLSAPGDGSFFFDAGMDVVQLNTFKGNKYVVITSMLTGTPQPQLKEIVTKLMDKAVSKI